MNFYMPTKVYQEENAVMNHASEIAELGKKALIVTGRNSSAKNGSLDDVKKALESSHTEYIIYNEIDENPTIASVMEAAKLGRSQGADFVIGIGGGSPMDAAKAIALMIQNRDSSEDVLYENIALKALPVVEVPTTCGTGSEVTPYAILTRDDKKTKQSISHKIYPVIACVDAGYLSFAPKNVLVNTAVDALGHLIESYFNTRATDYSRMICLYAMEVWSESVAVLRGEEPEKEDFESMMFASTLAGMAITHTSTTTPHGLSYYLTYNMGIPHGKAVGYFLPGYLNAMPEELKDDVTMVIEKIGFKDMEEFLYFIKESLGQPAINEDDVENMVTEAMANPIKLKAVPFELTADDVRDIIEFIL